MASQQQVYKELRASVQGQEATQRRVEVNQRALIDKILARYAAKHAVFRELLANSNDASATVAEIKFTTTDKKVVSVVYRNNGTVFRPQDWERLQKIAEGNDDPLAVGCFGVGAYTMFSICEEPLIISGDQSLRFTWKEDALWTKIVQQEQKDEGWTSFVLSMRDLNPLPDLVQFGQFLCQSLTFTDSLREIRVLVNEQLRLKIGKTIVQEPTALAQPVLDGEELLVTDSPEGIFSLDLSSSSILKSKFEISVQFDDQEASIEADCISAKAQTCLPLDLVSKMVRVTKKMPSPEVSVQVLQPSIQRKKTANKNNAKATRIVRTFAPSQPGSGRIFIGFQTSQTTGLAAHVGAPFYPTVEREAMDLQDPTLRLYNLELLGLCGIVLRLSLEQSMSALGQQRSDNEKQRGIAAAAPAEEEKESGIAHGLVALFWGGGGSGSPQESLLTSNDPLPLSEEERQAVLLVKSFCPRESTPESLVGRTVVEAFKGCRPNRAPPVLTRSGVVPGNKARIPIYGIDKFVTPNVVRPAIYLIATEYHDQIAGCKQLQVMDLYSMLDNTVLDEERLVLVLTWWIEFYVAPHCPRLSRSDSVAFLNRIRFIVETKTGREVYSLKQYSHYNRLDMIGNLPVPDYVLPSHVMNSIGMSIIGSRVFGGSWVPLSIEDWVSFISKHKCMQAGKDEDGDLRMKVLAAMSQTHSSLPTVQRHEFGLHCAILLRNAVCLPYDVPSTGAGATAIGRPSDLFLRSAIVKIKRMHKVSESLKVAGVSDDFLIALGVRACISANILLLRLNDLDWGDNPKTLLEYLLNVPLTKEDVLSLRQRQYLHAQNHNSVCFSPGELCFPDPELARLFPFVKQLQWPEGDDIFRYSRIVAFLRALGMQEAPGAILMLKYVAEEVKDETERIKCLNFICKDHCDGVTFHSEEARGLKFLPCIIKNPLQDQDWKPLVESLSMCYMDQRCAVMGFPVLDTELGDKREKFGKVFRCDREPKIVAVFTKFGRIVEKAKEMTSKITEETDRGELCHRIMTAFHFIFEYLSLRVFEFDNEKLASWRTSSIIPCKVGDSIEWARPSQVLFKSEGTDPTAAALFYFIDENRFMSAVGVKYEPTNQDYINLLMASPQAILDKLGCDAMYLSLLRRLAMNGQLKPDCLVANRHVGSTAFLLAYTTAESDRGDSPEQIQYKLAKPGEIYIVDNCLFGRMFRVLCAPGELDLEAFYLKMGCKSLSQEVKKKFQVDNLSADTPCTEALRKAINKRRPLLVSPKKNSRPLVENAVALLDETELEIVQAENIFVVYSLGGLLKSLHRKETTCCVKPSNGTKHTLYVTKDFDWFDVGHAIGELIFRGCGVEEAFCIGALLETPLELLRARGFPVDQVIVRKAQAQVPMSISDSLFSAAQSAAAHVSSLGAAQKEALFGGNDASSWFVTTSPISLFRSAVEERTIEPEENTLSAPLLEEYATGFSEESPDMQASSLSSQSRQEPPPGESMLQRTEETSGEEFVSTEEKQTAAQVAEDKVQSNTISYLLDWL